MKHLTSIALTAILAVAAIVVCQPVQAQTTTTSSNTPAANTGIATNIPNFFNTAMSWMTLFNTNYCWTNTTVQFEDGLVNETGISAADYIRGQYNWGRFNVAAEGQFFGTGAAFNDVEGGIGYAFLEHCDLKAEFNVLAGGTKINADTDTMKFKMEPELKLSKYMTSNTYATISLSVPWVQSQTFNGTPAFRFGLGCSF